MVFFLISPDWSLFMNAKNQDRKTITVSFDVSELEKIDALANKYGINRSQFIRNLVGVGLDQAILLESVGVLPVVNFGANIFDKLKAAIRNGSVNFQGDNIIFPSK